MDPCNGLALFFVTHLGSTIPLRSPRGPLHSPTLFCSDETSKADVGTRHDLDLGSRHRWQQPQHTN